MSNLTKTTEERPTDVFAQMRREMDTLLHNWFGRVPWPSNEGLFTPCELQESDDGYTVRFDVPGMSEKDIKVSFQGDSLTIQGERREQKSEGHGTTRYTERSYGNFVRTVALPAPIKADQIRARYKDGVMEVSLPKAHRTSERQIKVETA